MELARQGVAVSEQQGLLMPGPGKLFAALTRPGAWLLPGQRGHPLTAQGQEGRRLDRAATLIQADLLGAFPQGRETLDQQGDGDTAAQLFVARHVACLDGAVKRGDHLIERQRALDAEH